MPATVVHAADYGGPYPGSFIPMLMACGRAVRAAGWSFECVFSEVSRGRPWLDLLEEEQIEVRFAPGGGRRALGGWLARRIVEVEPPVLLHTHFTGFDLPATIAARRTRDAAVLWHVHSFLRRDPLRAALATVKFRLLSRGVTMIAVSDATAAAIRARGGPADRIHVVENGIDTERFAVADATARAAARERLGIAPSARVLVHFAWNWELKGGPLFAETVAGLHASDADVVALSVGGGEPARAAAAALGLDGVLRPVEQTDDVRPLYAAADAFVACSPGEGAPLAMLEVLSCGTPVVATDIPGHRPGPELPRALRLGPPDPSALADLATAAFARSPQAAEAEAAEAHRWVAEHRGLASWAERILALYREILGRRSAG